jgi:hypothetical protein
MSVSHSAWITRIALVLGMLVLSGCCTRHRTVEVQTKTTRTVSEQIVVQ